MFSKTATVASSAKGCKVSLARISFAGARHKVQRSASIAKAFSPTAPSQNQEVAEKSILDLVVSSVLNLFDEPKPTNSDELQLPPELKAYIEEMEAHSGSHGGWVHSHIAERLATDSSADM